MSTSLGEVEKTEHTDFEDIYLSPNLYKSNQLGNIPYIDLNQIFKKSVLFLKSFLSLISHLNNESIEFFRYSRRIK